MDTGCLLTGEQRQCEIEAMLDEVVLMAIATLQGWIQMLSNQFSLVLLQVLMFARELKAEQAPCIARLGMHGIHAVGVDIEMASRVWRPGTDQLPSIAPTWRACQQHCSAALGYPALVTRSFKSITWF